MQANQSQRRILPEEIGAHSLSFSDYNGRLFSWRGGLYRAIPADQSGLYRALFEQGVEAAGVEAGVVRSLIQFGLLIDTEPTDLQLDAYDLVLRHRRLPFVSYPAEWCDAMFKAATLLHLDLCIALDRADLTTDDAHPINILFEGTQPRFVDFGSITRLPKDIWYCWPWPPYEQFCQVFWYPLLLRAHGQGRLARWCAHDFERGVLKSEMAALIRRPMSRSQLAEFGRRWVNLYGEPLDRWPSCLRPIVRKTAVFVGRWLTKLSGVEFSRGGFLRQVRAEVAGIQLPAELPAELPADSGLGDKGDDSISQAVRQILADLQPRSVLDVNSGDRQGDYAVLAAEVLAAQDTTSDVVSIAPTQIQASALYCRAIAQNLPILSLILNPFSPSHGLSNSFLAPAHERLQCELVMALMLEPEFFLKRGFDFVIHRLAAFSSRWLLLAFTPQPQASLTTRWQDRTIDCPWYTLENFEAALRHHFPQVKVIPSDRTATILLLCERST